MIYADYGYYRFEYLGERLTEERFERFSRMASVYLDRITFDRAQKAAESEAVKLACCAVAEAMDAEGAGRISSEMVGNWSRAYRLEDSSAGRRLYDAAALYLDGTGLLFRGGC